jgi:hypothetical protein
LTVDFIWTSAEETSLRISATLSSVSSSKDSAPPSPLPPDAADAADREWFIDGYWYCVVVGGGDATGGARPAQCNRWSEHRAAATARRGDDASTAAQHVHDRMNDKHRRAHLGIVS